MQLLKILIFTGFLGASLSSFASGGVINTGGGGLTNPDPIAVDSVVRFIQTDAYFDVLGWLNSKMMSEQVIEENDGTRPLEILYAAPRDAVKIARDLKIEVKTNGPCFDGLGNEVDASIHSDLPGHICVSAKNISDKVSPYLYKFETAALIVHEVAHLAGLEDEAVIRRIQVKFIRDFVENDGSSSFSWMHIYRHMYPESNPITALIEKIDLWVEQPISYSSKSYFEFLEEFQETHDILGADPFLNTSLVDPELALLMYGEKFKIDLISDYHKLELDQNDHVARGNLEEGFQDDDIITAGIYYERLGGVPNLTLGRVVIERPVGRDSILRNLSRTRKTLSELRESIFGPDGFANRRFSVSVSE